MKRALQRVVSVSILALIAGGVSACAQEMGQAGEEDPNFDPFAAPKAAMTDPHAEGRHDQHDALRPLPGGVDLVGSFVGLDGEEVGTAMLADTPTGLLLRVEARGVSHGFHGVHLHETGLCEPAEGFKTAGGHANPAGAEHGYLVDGGSHAGDLPNAYAHQEGHIRTDLHKAGVAISDVSDEDGFAVMIHSGADDYESQPSGDAGDRVACAAFPG